MPSPFPGMDPHLEGSLWTTFHAQLAAEIARQLAPLIRPKYLALTTERFVYDEADSVAVATSNIYPDVAVAHTGRPASAPTAAAVAAPVQMATVVPQRVPTWGVEIRDVMNRQLVTAIEVLSPTNKRGRGPREYLAKRRRILLSSTHLLEIDLLRDGQRIPMRGELPAADYYVILTREEQRPISDLWPFTIRQSLPKVAVPLLAPDVDVELNLQAAFDAIYDGIGYDLAIDYHAPPEVPLGAADADWAVAHIANAAAESP